MKLIKQANTKMNKAYTHTKTHIHIHIHTNTHTKTHIHKHIHKDTMYTQTLGKGMIFVQRYENILF